jgi:hypothetical protein
MKIKDTTPGQVVRFVTKVERSSKGQEIQNVEMRVEQVSDTHITGINVNRILDGTQESPPYRTYKIANIVPDTVWLKLDN